MCPTGVYIHNSIIYTISRSKNPYQKKVKKFLHKSVNLLNSQFIILQVYTDSWFWRKRVTATHSGTQKCLKVTIIENRQTDRQTHTLVGWTHAQTERKTRSCSIAPVSFSHTSSTGGNSS